jgi:hypothetical protein
MTAIFLQSCVVRFPGNLLVFLGALRDGSECSIEKRFLCKVLYILVSGISDGLAATQKDVMGIITLEIMEEDRVREIPVVASCIAVRVGRANVHACAMLVVVVADLVRELELLIADATSFNLPMLHLLLGGQSIDIVFTEMFVSVITALLDVLHVLHPKISDGLIGFPNLRNLPEDLIFILLPNHLVEAVGQDLVNRGGRLRGNILNVIRLFV